MKELNLNNPFHKAKKALLSLFRDKSLSPSAKNFWILYANFEEILGGMTQAQIGEFIGVKECRLRRIQRELIKSGWLEKKRFKFGGTLEYRICYPFDKSASIETFLQHSQIFKSISFENDLKKPIAKFGDDAVYKVLSLIEFTYTRPGVKKVIQKPLSVFFSMLPKNIPGDDFNPDWWIEYLEKKEKILSEKKEKQKEARSLEEDRAHMDKWLKTLPADEYDRRRREAITALKSNGGLPDHGKEITIKLKMYEMSFGGKEK